MTDKQLLKEIEKMQDQINNMRHEVKKAIGNEVVHADFTKDEILQIISIVNGYCCYGMLDPRDYGISSLLDKLSALLE